MERRYNHLIRYISLCTTSEHIDNIILAIKIAIDTNVIPVSETKYIIPLIIMTVIQGRKINAALSNQT